MPDIILHNSTVTQDALAMDFNNSQRGKIYLLYGDKRVFQLSLLLASHSLIGGNPIAVIDGCSRFNVHTISHFARQHRLSPEILLNRIYVSRGFTSYQMEAAIRDRLAPFLKRIKSDTALIFGLLDTFFDEQVPFREAKSMLQRIIAQLVTMKKQGISVLIASEEWNVLPKERNQFFSMIKNTVDAAYKLVPSEEGAIQKKLEPDDEIKLIKERSTTYGTHTTDIHKNNR